MHLNLKTVALSEPGVWEKQHLTQNTVLFLNGCFTLDTGLCSAALALVPNL